MTLALLPVSAAEAAYYQRQMQAHGDDPVSGTCPVCRRMLCQPYREARGALAAAGVIDWDPIREMREQQERRQRLWQESLRDNG